MGDTEAMTLLVCDPPRRLALSWTGQDRWEAELDLSSDGDPTVLPAYGPPAST